MSEEKRILQDIKMEIVEKPKKNGKGTYKALQITLQNVSFGGEPESIKLDMIFLKDLEIMALASKIPTVKE